MPHVYSRHSLQWTSWQAALPDGLVDSGAYWHEVGEGVLLLHVAAVPLLLRPPSDDPVPPRRDLRPSPPARTPRFSSQQPRVASPAVRARRRGQPAVVIVVQATI